MLYLFVILISMAIIATLNIIFAVPVYGFSPLYVILAVIISTVVEIAISGVVAAIIRYLMPARWFGVERLRFSAGKKEKRFYEKIGIKRWKDKVLELGSFSGFHKDKIAEPNNIEYVTRFITEANYGVLIHFVAVIAGFAVIFVYPLKFWYIFGLPVALVGAVLNLMPAFILRYNLTKLHSLYKYNKRRDEKAANQVA